MSYLSIQRLSKTFDDTPVLKGLHLEVAKGEFVSLLGASGSGKTTILRCLAGLERPDFESGPIVLNGVELSHKRVFMPPEKRNLGLVFQNYAIWPHLNLFENVAFPLRVKKVGDSRKIEQRVNDVLELVQLQELTQRYGYQLSGGQQQRVALARALVMSPDLLLLDEPLSNLDAILREELGIQIRKLTKKLGLTTILVTHDQSEALSLSDRLVLLNYGEIETQGRPEELYRNPPTEFSARFLSKAQEIFDLKRKRQLFLPRNWSILEGGEGIAVTIASRIFLGSEYQYLAENSQYKSPILFYSPRRIEQDEVVHLQYRE